MLDILRKHASTWLIKFILASIVIVFVFYFGTTTLRRGTQTPREEVMATVNGRPITRLELNGYVQKVKDQNPDLYKNIPEALKEQFEAGILGSIIEERIVTGEAKKMGLVIANEEVAAIIQKTASLGKEGSFNEMDYHEKFRPWHLGHYGFDFEEWIRNILLVEKMKKIFADAIVVSEAQVKNTYEMGHTRVKLKKIDLNPVGEQKATELATQLWPLYLTGKSVADQLKLHKLTETETPFVSLLDIDALFDGAFDAEAAIQLFSLSKNNPHPPAPMKVGSRLYFFKLVDQETPDWEEFEKNKAAEQEKLKGQLAQAAFDRWYREKAKAAKIE